LLAPPTEETKTAPYDFEALMQEQKMKKRPRPRLRSRVKRAE
jgi:hypothetical protein